MDDFDAIADGDDADNERNAWTACYERPAVLAMVGDVRGLRVLDAGCGGGLRAAALIERGAAVTGIDASAAMLRIARRRLHGRAELVQADLRRPLPLDDGTFDIVLASLVLHHLRDGGGRWPSSTASSARTDGWCSPPTIRSWTRRSAAARTPSTRTR